VGDFNSLGKLVFPCERVDARWGKLECEQRACDLQGTTNFDED
jgi:FAD-linked sulfhydryl oxidase